MIDHITAVFAADGLAPTERLLLLAYANHADAHGYTWAGVPRLMDETGLSRATIKRTNATLRKKQLIASGRRVAADGRQITNLTRLNVARLHAMKRKDRTYDDNLIEELTFPEDDASSQVSRGAHSEPPQAQHEPPGGLTVSPPQAQHEPPGGLTVSPKPSQEPSLEPSGGTSSSSSSSSAPAPAREPEPRQEEQEEVSAVMETALAVVDKAAAMWAGHRLPTASERLRLAERAAQALAEGAQRADLVYALSRDLSDARSAVAVVMARTQDDGWWRHETAPAAESAPRVPRPEWCGRCDRETRMLETPDAPDGREWRRCPACHPLKVGEGARREDVQDDADVIVLDVIEVDQDQADDGDVVDIRAYR